MGIRVIKTALAAVLAIYINDWLSLSSPVSAGLLAVLGVEATRKRTIRNVLEKFGSSALALLFAALLFLVFGFHNWVIGLFILTAFPILSRMKLKGGIVISSVIMFHIFSKGQITFPIFRDEVLLLIVGLGSGALINLLYMPGTEEKLEKMRERLEDLFSAIFIQIASHLREHNTVWDGKELLEAQETIKLGLELANRSAENQLFRLDHYWFDYFNMRRQQMESIQRMVGLVAHIYETLPHGGIVAELFEELSSDVKLKYYTGNVADKLEKVEKRFKEMDLPRSRNEFEVRSSIMQLTLELKHYMSIAKKEKKKVPE